MYPSTPAWLLVFSKHLQTKIDVIPSTLPTSLAEELDNTMPHSLSGSFNTGLHLTAHCIRDN